MKDPTPPRSAPPSAGRRSGRALPVLAAGANESAGIDRRDFVKTLGVAAATTAMIGCTQEQVEKLIPYMASPDQMVPGVSTYYATTCRECAAACGLIAETRDGRAIKLEGNPAHPLNRGAVCARGQASLQGLYNPDRYRSPRIRRGDALEPTTWDEALRVFAERVADVRRTGQAPNALFINQHESGFFLNFLDEWLAAMGMPPHISYDASADFATIAANRQTFQVSWPRYDFSAARLVVSFGADFLDAWGPTVPLQLDWAEARAQFDRAPQLVYVGPRRSLTGLNADEWIDCRPGSEIAIARMLFGDVTTAQASQASGVDAARLERLRTAFLAASPSLVLGGGSMDVALMANAINQQRGNVGSTVRVDTPVTGYDGMNSPADVRTAVERMRAGTVSLLMVRNVDPAYTLGAAAGFTEAMARVPFKVSFSPIMDETSEMCDLILPDHHALEQWGVAESVRGTLSLQQPVMNPVFSTRPTTEVLMAVGRTDPAVAARYAAPTFREWLMPRLPGGANGAAAALPRGLAEGTIGPRTATRLAPLPRMAPPVESTQGNLYLVLYTHPVLADGRGANKPWLQELPDPATKILWQTVAEVHPDTARQLGVKNGQMVQVRTQAGTLTLPVYAYLGTQRETVAIAIGRGHRRSGRYASAGANAFDLMLPFEDRSGAPAYVSTRAQVERAPGFQPLVTTEGSARQHGRGIGRAVLATRLGRGYDIAHYGGGLEQEPAHHDLPGDHDHAFLPGLRAPIAADAQGELVHPGDIERGMYDPNHWSRMASRRWAMTVDLARCTGCSACVTACYAENNIPTVGADWQGARLFPGRTGFGANVLRSREMAWIRLERYFEGGEDGSPDFDTRFVPMLCQHCGNAPCEPVCPVYATYHAPDGLNVQVYNRCVGTRYCSNNCPYKVRYFNWFGYGEPNRSQYAFPEPLNWQLNPDVTVRGKGVMEKCTFCVQRIREAENRAAAEGRELQPDEFTVACAQACPSRAITFGDAADERWAVNRFVNDERAYHVFEELNTYTAVVYLRKVVYREPAAPQRRLTPMTEPEATQRGLQQPKGAAH
jgi:anaerobic selenocysteine-containing dehydrogenase/Fe-S-cluster-containing dehydrogenase component